MDSKISDAQMTGNHALGTIEYEFLQAVVELFADEGLLFEGSMLFTGADSLEQAGHLSINVLGKP